MAEFIDGLSTRMPATLRCGTALALSALLVVASPMLAQDDSPPDDGPAVAGEPGPEGPGIEEDKEAQEKADEDALASELASAQRIKEELDAALLPDGRVGGDEQDEVVTRLANLATRCSVLANSAVHDQTRLVLLGYEARALAALAPLEEPNADDPLGQRRLKKLRSITDELRELDLPNAVSAGDYWQLCADLAEASQAEGSVPARQALAEELLAGYIEAHANRPGASEYLVDTRLSLARMLDERGDQRGVAKQLDALGKLPEDSARQPEIKQLRVSVERLDKPIGFEAVTTRLEVWRSADFAGKPVLIHIYADTVEPATQMIDTIQRAIGEGSLSGIAIVSLRVGEPVADTPMPPWPTLPVQLEQGGVLDQLGVTSLPTLAWLDGQGRLVSIGHTAAVLTQRPVPEPEPELEPEPEAGDEDADETP